MPNSMSNNGPSLGEILSDMIEQQQRSLLASFLLPGGEIEKDGFITLYDSRGANNGSD